MVKKLLATCCIWSLAFLSIAATAQIAPPPDFRRQLVVDPVVHTATAIQTVVGSNESYTMRMSTRPFADGDLGVTYDNQGNVTSVVLFKLDFTATVNGPGSDGTPGPTTLEKVITVSYDVTCAQLKIDNRPDLNHLLQFVAGSSIDHEASFYLNTLAAYFPVKCDGSGVAAALSGMTDFFRAQAATDPQMNAVGGVIGAVVVGVVCVWICPIAIGCAIGAGGINKYWASCVGVGPST